MLYEHLFYSKSYVAHLLVIPNGIQKRKYGSFGLAKHLLFAPPPKLLHMPGHITFPKVTALSKRVVITSFNVFHLSSPPYRLISMLCRFPKAGWNSRLVKVESGVPDTEE